MTANTFRKTTFTRLLLALSLVLSVGFANAQSTGTKTGPEPAVAKDKTSGTFVTTPTLTKESKQTVLDKVNEIIGKTAFVPGVNFEKWPEFLATERDEIDKAETPRQFSLAVNKALRKFGFSHIVMATPEAAQARLKRQSVGIGVSLQPETEGLRVINLFPGAPAEEAGIQVGDIILEGDGKKAASAIDLLGEEGSVLTLKVKKLDGKTKDYKLVRRKYSNVRPETLTWANKDTAVLKVNTFDLSYDRDRVEALMTKAAPAKNLIVDLRNNPGGSIVNLAHLMGLLLPPDTSLGTFISRYTVEHYQKEHPDKPITDLSAIAQWSKSKLRAAKNTVPPFKGHLAVLVNGGSGSASEIAAAAMKDAVDAPIVGTKSAGAVLVSVMAPLPEGFILQYPITDFVTPGGVRLEGTGVTPTIETPGIVKFGEPDPAIDKAIMLLQRAELRDERGHSGATRD